MREDREPPQPAFIFPGEHGHVSTVAPARALQAEGARRRGAPALSQRAREGVVALLVGLGALGVIYMWWHDTARPAYGGPARG